MPFIPLTFMLKVTYAFFIHKIYPKNYPLAKYIFLQAFIC